jgi:hypothetical protein
MVFARLEEIGLGLSLKRNGMTDGSRDNEIGSEQQ